MKILFFIFCFFFCVNTQGQEIVEGEYLKEFDISMRDHYNLETGTGPNDIYDFSEVSTNQDRTVILLEPSLQELIYHNLKSDPTIFRCTVLCMIESDSLNNSKLKLSFHNQGSEDKRILFDKINREAQKIKVTVLLNRAKKDTFLFIIGYRKSAKKGDGL